MVRKGIEQTILEQLKNCQFKLFCDTCFADDFHWIIRGSSILSGEYYGKEEFFNKVINRINSKVLPGWTMNIRDSYLLDNTFIVEMVGSANTINGKHYNNEYCWIMKFNENSKIKCLIAYYDSLLVNQTLLDH